MSGTVVIDDDDVVMVEAAERTEIIYLDGKEKSKVNTQSIVSIDLDEDVTAVENTDRLNIEQTSRRKSTEVIMDSEKEKSFVMLLKNNTIMNKIVQRCLTMENNSGMARVINKTLVPLYQDVDNVFKQSELLSEILNKVLSNLKTDPNHKFLHIKSLCEELKAKKYRRKVPFITLTTDVKKNPRRSCRNKMKEKFKQFKIANRKTEHVIYLDNSDDEPVITVNDGDDKEQSANNKNNNQNNGNNGYSVDSSSSSCDSDSDDSDKNDKITHNGNDNSHNNNSSDNDDVKIVEDFGEAKIVEDIGEVTIVDDEDTVSNESNKENKIGENNNQIEDSPDCELLVPSISVEVEKHSRDFSRAVKIEKEIRLLKEKITELEEAEVKWESVSSPYMLCHEYKAKVVALYKKLCKLTGNGDGDLKKQRVVRLRVIEGHPPGPVMRLERFLNSTIDETGSVPLPDFHDVVRCVTQSNIADRLGWSKQEIMKEAIALFTHCGNALRKQRQKREYKDLMSLVRDKEVDDDDPAANNPWLYAKLEENKLIAKAKEDEVFERYVKKQFLPRNSEKFIQQARQMRNTRPSVSFDSDSDNDSDLTPKKKVRRKKTFIPVPHNQNRRESSNKDAHKVIQDPSISINNILNDEESRIRNGLTNPNLPNSFIATYINTILNSNTTTQNPANTTLGTNAVNSINNMNAINSVNVFNPANTLLGTSLNAIQNSVNNVNAGSPILTVQLPANNTNTGKSVNGVFSSPNTSLINSLNGLQYPINSVNASNSILQLPVNNMNAGNSVNAAFSPVIRSFCSLNAAYAVNNTNTLVSENIIRQPINNLNTNSSANNVQCPINVKTVSSINKTYNIENTTLNCPSNTIPNPLNNINAGSSKNIIQYPTNKSSGGASVNVTYNVINTAVGNFLQLDPSTSIIIPVITANNTGNITSVTSSNTKQYDMNYTNTVSSVNTTIGRSVSAIESTVNTTATDTIENPVNNIKQETPDVIENTENVTSMDAAQSKIKGETVYVTQNIIRSQPSDNITKNTVNTNTTDPRQNIISSVSANTTRNNINATSTVNTINNINGQPPANTIQNSRDNVNTPTQTYAELNILQKVGVSNRYVIAYDSEKTINNSPQENIANNNKPPETEKDVTKDVTIKSETDIKKEPEPLDIPKLLDALGNNYIATIFDIEDPFLIIEVSDSSDDEDL